MVGSETVVHAYIKPVRFEFREQPVPDLTNEIPDSSLLIGRQFVNARDMLARDHKGVALRDWVGICEGNRVLVFDQFAAGVEGAERAGHRS